MTFIQAPVPYIGANRPVNLGSQPVTTIGLGTFGNLDVDTLNLNGNVISDSTGTVSFADDHVQTTANIYNKADGSKHYFGASDSAYCEYSGSTSAWDFYPGAKSMNINRGSFDATNLESTSYGVRIGYRGTTDATIAGAWAGGQYDGAGSFSKTVYGMNAFAYVTNSGDLTRTALPGAVGNFMEVQHQSTGTISLAAGALLRGKMTAAGTITRYADLKVMEFDRDAGTITTLVGLDIDALTEGGTNWGIYDAGNNWLLGAAGKHYFRDTAIGIYSQADTFLDLFADGGVRVGNSSAGAPTTYMELEANGDAFWVGAGSGLAYGSFYGNEIANANAVNNSYVRIADTDCVTGEVNLVTYTDAGTTLTVSKAGRYLITWSVAGESNAGGGAQHILGGIMIDSTSVLQAAGQSHYEPVAADKQVVLAGTAVISCPNGTEVIGVGVGSAANITITVDHVNLSIIQVGG